LHDKRGTGCPMRRIFIRQKSTQDDLTKLFGERLPKSGKPLTDLRAFGVVVSIFVGLAATGVAAFLVVAWLAWESHTFGPKDLRYLVFVRGSLMERVGIIAAQPGTLIYRGQGRDGNAPGYVRAEYASPLEASALFARFVERCRLLGLQVKQRAQVSTEGERAASCGRRDDDDYHVHMSVLPGSPTKVFLGEDIDDGLYTGQ
jgi:hypothetical protein